MRISLKILTVLIIAILMISGCSEVKQTGGNTSPVASTAANTKVDNTASQATLHREILNFGYEKLEIKDGNVYVVIHETNNSNADAMNHYEAWRDGNIKSGSVHFTVDNFNIYQMIELDTSARHVGGTNLVEAEINAHSKEQGFSNEQRKAYRKEKLIESYSINDWNSIGVDMCIKNDHDYLKTVYNTALLIKNTIIPELEKKGLKVNVVQHYNAWGKLCPSKLISGAGNITWDEFLNLIYK